MLSWPRVTISIAYAKEAQKSDMSHFSTLTLFARLTLLTLLMLEQSRARNFKYADELGDKYSVHKHGIIEDGLGTLFPAMPYQIFSCQFDVGYQHFTEFKKWGDKWMHDVFKYSQERVYKTELFYDYFDPPVFSTWSPCYQNFITRYCMQLLSDRGALADRYRIRMCKHLYYPNRPELKTPLSYVMREAKPYINFHILEHIAGTYGGLFDDFGLYPPGLEYFISWGAIGYDTQPIRVYQMLKPVDEAQVEAVHGQGLGMDRASFTILKDSWKMKLIQIIHEITWTMVANHRGELSHELINAYQEQDHLLLHYLTHMCTELLTFQLSADRHVAYRDILHTDMCPNPCREDKVCAEKPNTASAECIPTGLNTQDFVCDCMAGFEWNVMSQNCEEKFQCSAKCHLGHTQSCEFIPSVRKLLNEVASDGITGVEGHLVCRCYPEYQGVSCNESRNACETGGEGRQSGNELCRTDINGTCSPVIGTTFYSCNCPKGYHALKSIVEDNCQLMQTACHDVICANNGDCHNSPDGKSFQCECTNGFEGRFCEYPIAYQWTAWDDWTSCDSLCGQGWQISRRQCWDRLLGQMDVKNRCPGNPDVVRACDKHCLTEIQASHYIAISRTLELLSRMLAIIFGCFMVIKVIFDRLFSEADFVYVRYLRSVVLELVRNAVARRRREEEELVAQQQREELLVELKEFDSLMGL